MNLLITGGTVFASRYTAEYFRDRGHQVYVLNRGTRPQLDDVTLIQCDRHQLGNTLKAYAFDAVLDVASYTETDVAELLEALPPVRQYIFVSSSAVYPETNPQPFAENQPCGPKAIWGKYGMDKLAAEAYLRAHVPQAYIIRPPYLYGRMNNLYREVFVFECAEKNRLFYIPGDGQQPFQFFDIADMCRFMEILLEKQPAQRVFNVGNPEAVIIRDWVTQCYHAAGKEPELRFVDASVPQRDYFPFYDYAYQLDVSAMLGLMSTVKPLAAGLRESYVWYRENREQIRRKPLMDFIDEHLA